MRGRITALCGALALAALALPVAAAAHPDEAGEVYVPWTTKFDEQRSVDAFAAPSTAAAQGTAAAAGSAGLQLVGNADKDGTTNSDLAFWGNLAYAGHYGGFRILDITADQPLVVTDKVCNGPQNDVSVYEMGGKRFLFQSIDTPQTAEDCSSANAPLDANGLRVGYEGVRVFDVTNPTKPVFIDMIQTACGSHTHTLVPAGSKAYIYVASYPLGSNITPDGATGPGDFRPCRIPHKKISVIEVSQSQGRFRSSVTEKALSDDTTFNRGFQACHDFQAFMAQKVMLASCAGDAQLWDISDPANPTTDVEGAHTHIRSPSKKDQFEFIHSGVVTWDGRYFAIMDETGGGVTANCFGAATTDGFYYFYEMVRPGAPAPRLLGRYSIPRDQGSEVCVSHNATVVPVSGRYVMSAAYYQGGVTLVDFTNPAAPREIAYADLEDGVGAADEWSSYWYNGRIFSNSGLNRRGATANRGVDVFRPAAELGLGAAKTWTRSNPQTQEANQAP
jgi:hypothetical protein